MGKYQKTVGLTTKSHKQLQTLSGAFGKDKAEIVSQLINGVFQVYEDAVKKKLAKNGKISFNWLFEVDRFGKIIVGPDNSILVSKAVDINAPEPTTEEIEGELNGR